MQEQQNILDLTTSWERKGRTAGLAEGLRKGLLEGLEKGRLEGLEKGRIEGQVELLIRQAEKRFGVLSPDD
jgi:flagellar biosynthesis/type III secretory pathway protein FliH